MASYSELCVGDSTFSRRKSWNGMSDRRYSAKI